MAEKKKKNFFDPEQPGIASWRVWATIAISWLVISFFFSFFRGPQTAHLSYNAFKKAVESGRITEITIKKETVRGMMKPALKKEAEKAKAAENKKAVEGKNASCCF